MKNLKTVYVYRYDETKNAWTMRKIDKVFITGTPDAYVLSDTQNKKANVTLRIFLENVDIFPEDVICFRECISEKPEKPYVVCVSKTENTNGSKGVRHTKILCS